MDDASTVPLIVVDSANVVGSRPDGWWRDRRAATVRLRDRLAHLATTGLPHGAPPWSQQPPLEVVLITEGQANGVESIPTVTITPSPGSGDDTIVDTVEAAQGRQCVVITSDKGLQQRVTRAGAQAIGATILR